MTDERRPVPEPATPGTSAQVDGAPVDPDDARRLARRRFFRSFAADAMRTAATVVGAANALRDQSAEMAGALLGASPASPAAAGATERTAPGPPAGFRSAFRFEPEVLILLDQRRLPEELVELECVSGTDVAQAIPPAAFQNRNFHHFIRPRPATHAAVKRRMAMKRPKKTVFPPWRAMMRSARGSTRWA